MVDLHQVGERLASLSLAEPTPVADIRRRTRRRVRRRRLRRGLLGVVATVAVAVATVVATPDVRSQRVVTTPGPPPARPLGLPPIIRRPGSVPFDYGQLRLWLPPGWSTVPPGGCSGFDHKVYLGFPGTGPCVGVAAIGSWLAISASGAAPSPGSARVRINGVWVWTVSWPGSPETAHVYDVPSLGVEVAATGAGAQVVAGTLGPSSLHAVLEQRYPTTVPRSWKTVTDAGFQVRVPARWPVHLLAASQPTPWGCGQPTFVRPSVEVGAGVQTECPNRTPGTTRDIAPSDGLWLQSVAPATAHGLAAGQLAKQLLAGHLNETAVYGTNTAGSLTQEMITADKRTLTVTVGLGVDPTTAEQILSSFTVTGGGAAG